MVSEWLTYLSLCFSPLPFMLSFLSFFPPFSIWQPLCPPCTGHQATMALYTQLHMQVVILALHRCWPDHVVPLQQFTRQQCYAHSLLGLLGHCLGHEALLLCSPGKKGPFTSWSSGLLSHPCWSPGTTSPPTSNAMPAGPLAAWSLLLTVQGSLCKDLVQNGYHGKNACIG